MADKDSYPAGELELMRLTFDSAPYAACWIDQAGKIRHVNSTACRRLEYSRQELVQLFVWELTPSLDSGRWARRWQEIHERGHLSFESLYRTKSGRDLPVEVSAHCLEHDGVEYCFAAATDLTERKAALEALLAAERRYWSVADHLEIGMALISPQMEVLEVNRKTREWFPALDVSRRPTCFRAFNDPPRDTICTYCPTYLTFADGRVHEAVTDTPAGDQTVHFRVVSSPLKDAEGKVSAVIEMVEDITASRQAQEQLRRHREQLEEMVAERTLELARSNRELEQFAYIVSHDLQEPLRTVAGFTQLIARRYGDHFDEEGRQLLHFAVDGATRMQAMISNLLTLSRVGSGGGGLAPVDCNRVLATALENLTAIVKAKEAVIETGDLPTVSADERQLLQLFQNLVANAIKFCKERRPEVRIAAENRGGSWVFSVADNGIGIEPHLFGRLFVVFQRLHDRESYPGSGIGLAICKKVVERHGGRIWAESKPGEGSTFFFSLPGAP